MSVDVELIGTLLLEEGLVTAIDLARANEIQSYVHGRGVWRENAAG